MLLIYCTEKCTGAVQWFSGAVQWCSGAVQRCSGAPVWCSSVRCGAVVLVQAWSLHWLFFLMISDLKFHALTWKYVDDSTIAHTVP